VPLSQAERVGSPDSDRVHTLTKDVHDVHQRPLAARVAEHGVRLEARLQLGRAYCRHCLREIPTDDNVCI
jgi:hypothetical protein